jgi:hypothetical protein
MCRIQNLGECARQEARANRAPNYRTSGLAATPPPALMCGRSPSQFVNAQRSFDTVMRMQSARDGRIAVQMPRKGS